MIAAALAHRSHIFEPRGLANDCRVCQREDGKRMRPDWGCDERTVFPQLVIPCSRCRGYKPDCEICKGSGREAVYDCPQRAIAQTHGLADAIALHRLWPQTLPVAGGLDDQSARYVRAMRVLDEIDGLIEKTRIDNANA